MACPAQMYSCPVMENSYGLNNLYHLPQEELMLKNTLFSQSIENQRDNTLFSQSIENQRDEIDLLINAQSIENQRDNTLFSQSIENQRDEIDLLINAQNERLRLILQDQKRKELTIIMKKYDHLIKQRDEEILKAASRNMELQTHIKRMEIEVQKWQRLAHENESMAASLNGTIQRLRESSAEDAESCCFLEEDEGERRMVICRCCNYRDSCVVMLPCRHLCSCKYCDAFLDSCPLCNQVKKFSIDALL